jgi:flavin reductase (DIM6/NTAB) family NADH-FMN oxidoreductase RutF
VAIEKDFFRQVMGHFTTGVTVVTTKSQRKLVGLTVNSFTSISLNPPLVLICLNSASHTLPLFRESKIFAVNFLTAEQVDISRGFAVPSKERFEHFCHASYHLAATGAPILDDVLAFVDTRLVAEYPGGDHVIFVGQVEAMGTAGRVVFASNEGKDHSTLINYRDYTADVGNGSTPLPKAAPLIYYCGQYRHLADNYSEPSPADMYDSEWYQLGWWWDPFG